MDITELAEQITARLAPAMPDLPQAGDKVVAEAGEGLGAEARAAARFLYPYDPTDVREDLEAPANVRRVLLGGAFNGGGGNGLSASHLILEPGYRGSGIGFRVVVSPFFSER